MMSANVNKSFIKEINESRNVDYGMSRVMSDDPSLIGFGDAE